MSAQPLSILYLHCHDAGRAISPLGWPVLTPNLLSLAERGLCFRNAHSVAPTCSPSRSALLTGLYPHQNGMLGLAHFGFALNDPRRHPVHRLREAGYTSALAGIQHIAEDSSTIGYDQILERKAEPEDVAQAVEEFFQSRRRAGEDSPFFLDVGLSAPHRRQTRFPYEETLDGVDPRYVRPIGNLPDTEESRTDTAEFLASVRAMDRGFGMVLTALERSGHAENTLVVCTTDHGPPFPDMKCTLRDDGTGVFLILAGPNVQKGAVSSALVTHLDIYPTMLEAAGLEVPADCEGTSLWPILRGRSDSIRDRFYGEINFHVAYEPVRSVRTERWKYIRRFDQSHLAAVFPNCDEGLSRRLVVSRGWLESARPVEELYDLLDDPNEQANLATIPDHAQIVAELKEDLFRWMERTSDPLLQGPITPVRPWRHPPSSDRSYSNKN